MESAHSTPPRTLIADDQTDVLEALRLLLKGEGYQTEAVTSPGAVLDALRSRSYDVLLMDLNYARDTTSGQEGLDLLTSIQKIDATLPIVVITAWGTVDLAVEAMRRGVRDFVQKPWENARLLNTMRAQVERGQMIRKGLRLEAERKSLSREIVEIADPQEMLKLVAEHLQEALQSRAVVIFTKAPRDNCFWATARVGVQKEILGRLKFAPSSCLLSLMDSFIDTRLCELPEEEQLKLAKADSLLIAPIKLKGELAGFISLGDKLSGVGYDDDDRQFLGAVIEQIGVGMSNSRLRGQDEEFREARQIQHGLLPKVIPQITGYEVSTSWRPAREVSGDYFDVLKFNDDSMALCIADVVGKGMPAALLMSNVQAAVKAFASETIAPSQLCTKVNRVVCSNMAADKFITFFYCLLDARSRRLVYTNAGHNPPILVSRDGASMRLTAGGALLGPFPEWRFEQGEIELESGHRILLFTDGVTEVTNADGEEFGEERLIDLVIESRMLDAAALQARVTEAITEFGEGTFHDDATLVVLCVD